MLKRVLKSILRHTPYRVIRARDANRFQAIAECLISLAARRRDNRAHQGDFLFVRCDSPLMADTAWG